MKKTVKARLDNMRDKEIYKENFKMFKRLTNYHDVSIPKLVSNNDYLKDQVTFFINKSDENHINKYDNNKDFLKKNNRQKITTKKFFNIIQKDDRNRVLLPYINKNINIIYNINNSRKENELKYDNLNLDFNKKIKKINKFDNNKLDGVNILYKISSRVKHSSMINPKILENSFINN